MSIAVALSLDSELLQSRLYPSFFIEHKPYSAVAPLCLCKTSVQVPQSPLHFRVEMWYAWRAPGWRPGVLDSGLSPALTFLGN